MYQPPGLVVLSIDGVPGGLRGRHIWEILSESGRKVFGMNSPGAFPPRAVNGVLVGGFLSPSPEKGRLSRRRRGIPHGHRLWG